jgi:3-hydroxybutyryl-CoA dehydratase
VTCSTPSLSVGVEYSASYEITTAVHEAMTEVFCDRNPLHVDEAFAVKQGFAGRVMHGAILNAFLSQFIGMEFPAAEVMLLSTQLQYLRPSYLGDVLDLSARVAQRVESQQVIVLHLRFANRTRGYLAARGTATVRVPMP